ncbi:methylamine utilization protein MauG [Sulfurimonas sp. MAG313]|nr:cytochrome c peroxidase [Sulfurimonas sp. MAG313]MDF1881976.1 methylamine utilization protein MauG [Sulfurimonas sp. MAG313]
MVFSKISTFFFFISFALFLSGCSSEENSSVIPSQKVDTNISQDTNETIPKPVELVFASKIALGKALFHDRSLSLTRKQSCASCHDPLHAFIDNNDNGVNSAVSLGDDGLSLGDRNAPTLTYAAYIPSFFLDKNNTYVGGQFFDGRASDLEQQAKAPFLNNLEMQMPNIVSVVQRVKENQDYVLAMKKFFDVNIFDEDELAFSAVANAIAEFERLPSFASFDSKVDLYTPENEGLSAQELQGQDLFVKLDCVSCHLDLETDISRPLFTNFEYENLGVPINQEVRALNKKSNVFIDHGLLDNPNITDPLQDGRFKVPTLRNIAVTGPYMHNGVFKELKTVIHFYNTRDVEGAINPETQAPWAKAEVNTTMLRDLRIGSLDMTNSEEDALVAYLRALTDERYTNLLP